MRFAVLMLLCVVGCTSVKRVSRDTFMNKVQAQSESTYDTSYIGIASGNAYLTEWEMNILFPDTRRILWTPAKDLTLADRETLKSIKEAEDKLTTLRPTAGPTGR